MKERILPHYTYDDRLHWEEGWELIDGFAYSLYSSSEPNHQRISANVVTEFGLSLNGCNKYVSYRSIDYWIKDDTILQPDMLIVSGEITKKYLDFPPALIAEIRTPATAYNDRHAKYAIYESQGVKYYIIIAPDKEEVEIYELLDGEYRLKQSGKDIVHEFFFPECTARVDFKEIW